MGKSKEPKLYFGDDSVEMKDLKSKILSSIKGSNQSHTDNSKSNNSSYEVYESNESSPSPTKPSSANTTSSSSKPITNPKTNNSQFNPKKNLKESILRSIKKNHINPDQFSDNTSDEEHEEEPDSKPNPKKQLKESILRSLKNNKTSPDQYNDDTPLESSNSKIPSKEKENNPVKSQEENPKKNIKEKILSAMKNSGSAPVKSQPMRVVDDGMKSIQFDGHIDMRNLKQNLNKNLFLDTTVLSKETENSNKERYATGINGFDELIEGGFIKGSTVLVKGGPGSGKSIFAMQYLINGIEDDDQPGVYISFEQEPKDLVESMAPFNWNLDEKVKNKKLALLYFSPEQINRVISIGGGPIREIIDSIGAKRIVIDSISAFVLLSKTEEEQRKLLFNLYKNLKKWDCTSLLVSEHTTDMLKHRATVEEYQSEAVIMLYHDKKGEQRERSIEVFKMRGTNHSKKIYPLKITSQGIVVFPNQSVY